MPGLEDIRRGLEAADQTHVLRFWSELAEGERETFLQELALLDLEALHKHCERAREAAAAAATDDPPDRVLDMEPIPPQSIGSVRKSDNSALSEWEDQGLNRSRFNSLLSFQCCQSCTLLLGGAIGIKFDLISGFVMYKSSLKFYDNFFFSNNY